jgi:DNA-binding CsgD family transcriptional regulator
MRAREEILHAELVGRLFEAAIDPRRWAGLSADIAHAFDAGSGALLILGPQTALSYLDATANLAGPPMRDYAAYYRERDVWSLQARQPGWGSAQLGSDLVRNSEFEHTEFYTDFCRAAGVFHAIGCTVPLPDAKFGQLSIHRPRSARAFNEDDRSRLNALLPFFLRALQLRDKLQQASLGGLCGVALLDCVDTAVFLVDDELRLLHANAAAGALLVRDGALRLLDGRLVQQDSAGARSLGRMVRAVLAAAPGPQSLCLERRGRPPLLLTAAPFLAQDAPPGQSPRAVVMVRDPEAHRLPCDALRQLFGLTPAEAGVAQALAHGDALEKIAVDLDISLHTVKTHLQKLFRKTGTRRQGELVALLHATPAAMPAQGETARASRVRAM